MALSHMQNTNTCTWFFNTMLWLSLCICHVVTACHCFRKLLFNANQNHIVIFCYGLVEATLLDHTAWPITYTLKMFMVLKITIFCISKHINCHSAQPPQHAVVHTSGGSKKFWATSTSLANKTHTGAMTAYWVSPESS
jgi:hypothetical protein